MELLVKKLEYVDSQKIFEYVGSEKYTIFLDSSMLNEHYGRFGIIAFNPVEIFHGSTCINTQIDVWEQLFANNQQQFQNQYNHLPFTGGLIGFLSYDLVQQFEFISSDSKRIVDDFYFGLYNQAFIFDHIKQEIFIIVAKINGYDLPYSEQLDQLEEIYNNCKRSQTDNISDINSDSNNKYLKNTPHYQSIPKNYGAKEIIFKSNFTRQEYEKLVNRVIKYIHDGDVFEVNLAQCFYAKVDENYSSTNLYKKLRDVNPAPFSAYLNFGDLVVLSASPERFVSIRNRKVETRPIKGTIKRSVDIKEDALLAKQLQLSEKDRAENIMVVDLMRNDLSKVCKKDSVEVIKLCEVESFTNIHHLVSVINGELKDSMTIFDIIKATIPGGSITGAPKIRAMQIIEELEPRKRGVYCGNIGYFSFNGNVDLSIAIRTIIKNGTDMSFYVGGAVTLESDPVEEYKETLLKAHKLHEVFNESCTEIEMYKK